MEALLINFTSLIIAGCLIASGVVRYLGKHDLSAALRVGLGFYVLILTGKALFS